MRAMIAMGALFVAAHGLGFYRPKLLWGIDQLHYIPWGVVPMLGILCLGILLTANRRVVALGIYSIRNVSIIVRDGRWGRVVAPVLLFVAFCGFYGLRVQAHHLGDSAMWFGVFEALHLDPGATFTFIDPDQLHPELGFIAPYEILDTILHYQVFRLGNALAGWSPADAYLWPSCIAGLIYLVAGWRAACLLFQLPIIRIACFSALSSLGLMQLFFGYGESYTLVTAAMSVYILVGLRAVEGLKIWFAMGLFVLCCSLHAMALSLLPSVLFVCCRRIEFPRWLVPSRLQTTTAGAVLLACLVWVYAWHYTYALPLWPQQGHWQWWLFSPDHLLLLLNTLLLVSPFCFAWIIQGGSGGVQLDGRLTFLLLSALGPLALSATHNAYLGGRDWDLLSFPAYPLTLFSIALLLRGRYRFRRAVAMCGCQVPLMVIQTLLWVSINADVELGTRRLGNLLDSTNRSPHYEAFTRAHYLANIRQSPATAVPHFREAIALLPADMRQRRAQYYKLLGHCLIRLSEFEEGHQAYETGFGLSEALNKTTADAGHHTMWLLADYMIARERRLAGLPTVVKPLQDAGLRCAELMGHSPTDKLRVLCGALYAELGQHEEAQSLLQKGLVSEKYSGLACVGTVALGRSLARSKHHETIATLREALGRCDYRTEAPEIFETANELMTIGEYALAMQGYQDVLRRDSADIAARISLGWCQYKLGDYEGAAHHFSVADSDMPNSLAAFKHALVVLAKGDLQEAARLYSRALATYGSAAAQIAGATTDLQEAPLDPPIRARFLRLLSE